MKKKIKNKERKVTRLEAVKYAYDLAKADRWNKAELKTLKRIYEYEVREKERKRKVT